MAVVNFTNRPKSQTRAGMKAVIKYVMKDEKTVWNGVKLVSGLNCSSQSVYDEFITTKLLYRKDNGRMYYHFHQAFPKTEDISPATAHEIALKLAEYYKGFEVLVCTHADREHIHSHFIVNSVSFETGKKLHQSANAIQELRDVSDKLCVEYGLSVCNPDPERRIKGMTAGEYHTALKGQSWKMRLACVIDDCMQAAENKEMFIELMDLEGYQVKWTDTRRNITFTTPEGKKCSDDKLGEERYLKELMEFEFGIREKAVNRRTEKLKQTSERKRRSQRIWGETEFLYDAGRNPEMGDRSTGEAKRSNGIADQTDGLIRIESGIAAETDKECSGTDGEHQGKNDNGTVFVRTGWEKEREIFLSEKTETALHTVDEGTLFHNHSADSVCSGSDIQFDESFKWTGNNWSVEDQEERKKQRVDEENEFHIKM